MPLESTGNLSEEYKYQNSSLGFNYRGGGRQVRGLRYFSLSSPENSNLMSDLRNSALPLIKIIYKQCLLR